jgi:hypothetical protein
MSAKRVVDCGIHVNENENRLLATGGSMSTSTHTIRVILTVRMDDEDGYNHTPCEMMTSLLRYTSFREACSDAGMEVLNMEVYDDKSCESRFLSSDSRG